MGCSRHEMPYLAAMSPILYPNHDPECRRDERRERADYIIFRQNVFRNRTEMDLPEKDKKKRSSRFFWLIYCRHKL
jgi:hypothetical protein